MTCIAQFSAWSKKPSRLLSLALQPAASRAQAMLPSASWKLTRRKALLPWLRTSLPTLLSWLLLRLRQSPEMWRSFVAFFHSTRDFERALMSALSDLQNAVNTNSSLVASLIALEASKTGGTSDADLAAITATIAATNAAIQTVLTPAAPTAPAA
jgi:hypothetical protein